MTTDDAPFWKRKSLAAMSRAEWESLCDGCAKCCLAKLQDEDTGAVEFTAVACRLLDLDACRCTRYEARCTLVPDCVPLTSADVGRLHWLPSTCAYRVLANGGDLPWWHHLVSGDRDLVHVVGASVRGRVVGESEAGPLEHHIVTWPA